LQTDSAESVWRVIIIIIITGNEDDDVGMCVGQRGRGIIFV